MADYLTMLSEGRPTEKAAQQTLPDLRGEADITVSGEEGARWLLNQISEDENWSMYQAGSLALDRWMTSHVCHLDPFGVWAAMVLEMMGFELLFLLLIFVCFWSF